MNKCTFLAARLREVFLDGKWIANTNFKEQLLAVNKDEAVRKIGSLNSIAELTFHVTYYVKGFLHVMEGGELNMHDKYSFSLPPVLTQNDWEELRNDFLRSTEKFCEKVEKLPESRLDEYFVEEKYGTWQRGLEGVIEHSYYHLGQVSLLRKLG